MNSSRVEFDTINLRLALGKKALRFVSKILTLQDRNLLSPTYGCFDRNYWHYKIIDFPSGMAQEFSLVLALAYSLDIPNNEYYKNESIKEWAIAGINFAKRTSHIDGSCDDYYPFEKAVGATAFSLYAFAKSYNLLGIKNLAMEDFFVKRCSFLVNSNESGKLTNHHALIVNVIDLVSGITGYTGWNDKRENIIKKIISWQDEEGWFWEYEGFDPGYHTLTISLLAEIYSKKKCIRLEVAIQKAINLSFQFIHPDGSFGGEYGSRNTNIFFPLGFELFSKYNKNSTKINNLFISGLINNNISVYDDDHTIGHHAWNYLLAWESFNLDRNLDVPFNRDSFYLKNAGIGIFRGNNCELYVAYNKGGTYKYFRNNELAMSDTGITLELTNGKILVCNLIDNYETIISNNSIHISGSMGFAKHQKMTIIKMIVLRIIMSSFGRLFPNQVRKILQKILITGKKNSNINFEREIKIKNESIIINDKINLKDINKVKSVFILSNQTSIYNVMSNIYNKSQLFPPIKIKKDKDLNIIRYTREV